MVGEKSVYELYFLGERDDFNFNGRNYKMTATHQDTKEHVLLSEMDIQDSHSVANFGFNKEGLWKIEVLIDGENYISFIVEAKPKE